MQRYSLREMTVLRGDAPALNGCVPCSLQGILIQSADVSDPFIGRGLDAATEAASGGCHFLFALRPKREWLTSASVMLVLRDVHEVCDVLVNGQPMGRLCHVYDEGRYEIASLLHEGENEIRLIFPPRGKLDADYLHDGTVLPVTFDPSVGFAEILVAKGPSFTDVKAISTWRDGHGYVHIKAGLADVGGTAKVVAVLTASDGKMYYAGLPDGEGDLYVADPILWRAGDAANAYMYRLSLTLYTEDEPVDVYTLSLAFADRYVEEHTSRGEKDLRFFLNGNPLLLKGCRYFAASLYPSEKDTEQEEHWVRLAVSLGCNMLRIPSNCPPPSDTLLHICDTLGVFLWWDLPPMPYGEKETYITTMRRHARRLHAHPCLLTVTFPTEEVKESLSDIWAEEAPAVYTFACTETRRNEEIAVLTDLSDMTQIGRMTVACPPAALPAYVSVCRMIGADDNLYGKTMAYHAKRADVPSILYHASKQYPFPCSQAAAVYAADCALADALYGYITNERLAEEAPSGLFLPALFDLYPWTSDALIDGFGQRRAAFYAVRQALTPVLLFMKRQGYRVTFRGHNDRNVPYEGMLHYTLADRQNRILQSSETPVRIEPHGVADIKTEDFSTRVFRHESEYYLSAWLDDGRVIASHSVCLFTEPKYFAYALPDITTEVTGQGGNFEVRLRSKTFVHGVCVSFQTTGAVAQDNLADLTADLPVKLRVKAPSGVTAEQLINDMHIISVNHIPR